MLNHFIRLESFIKTPFLLLGFFILSGVVWPTAFFGSLLLALVSFWTFPDLKERRFIFLGLAASGSFLLGASFISHEIRQGIFFIDPLWKLMSARLTSPFDTQLWDHKLFIIGMSLWMAVGWLYLFSRRRSSYKGLTAKKGRKEEETARKDEDSSKPTLTLGVCVTTGQAFRLSDEDMNQGVLVLGTTGVGKSVTLRQFILHAVAQGYPTVVIDGKPVPDSIVALQKVVQRKSTPFYGFNCASFDSYDPLVHGGPTVLKDKIMALKDYWSHEYYKTMAEDYLQTMIYILLDAGFTLDFKRLIEGLDVRSLALLLRQKNKRHYQEELKRLASYSRQELMGLQIHLSVLAHSELGHYFTSQEQGAFSLQRVFEQNALAYFALPSLKYPHFSKTLGKLVLNDIKASLPCKGSSTPIYVVIDEFSVFAGEQVLNIINMGRELGVHLVMGTQGVADLVRVSSVFKDQLLNSINLMIAHQLNDHGSIEECVRWMGTEKFYKSWPQTTVHNPTTHSLSFGDVPRLDKEVLQRHLGLGEAMILSKRSQGDPQRIKIASGNG